MRFAGSPHPTWTTPQDAGIAQPYGFTGREYDASSGLYFYRARYYDPELGRFLNRDPIGFEGGDINLYRYVENGPNNWIDSSGEGPLGLAAYISAVAADALSTINTLNDIADKYADALDEYEAMEKTCPPAKTDLRKMERMNELNKEMVKLSMDALASAALGIGIGAAIALVCPAIIASPF